MPFARVVATIGVEGSCHVIVLIGGVFVVLGEQWWRVRHLHMRRRKA